MKVNDVVTAYHSYEWSGYTPLGMIVKAKNDADTFETKAYQFITNHRGDVLSIRDSEDNEVGAYTYDAYGNMLAAEGALAKENPIRYAGYYYDDETKNYYLQARYYNPANGSFLALDPHPGDNDEPLSQNGYSYANENPVMNVDSNGERAKVIIKGGKWVWKKAKQGGSWAWNKSKKIYKKFTLPDPKFSAKVVQKKYNSHGKDFGFKGNYNKKQAAKFEKALRDHIKNADEIIESKYHGKKVYVYIRGENGIYLDTKGNFISGWKFTSEQKNYHRTHGFRIK